MDMQERPNAGSVAGSSANVPPRPGRRRFHRYTKTALIGAALVFAFETPFHVWKSRGQPEEHRTEKLSQVNRRLLDAPKAVRPWDVAGTFYHRITSGSYSPKAWSLATPFRWELKWNADDARRKLEELEKANYDWSKMHSDQSAWVFSGANPVGFVLGIPDGVIHTVRKVWSGGWPNVLFNSIALVLAIGVIVWLRRARNGFRNWGWAMLCLPVVTSLIGLILWAVMWAATQACGWLSLPAASVWAFVSPGLIAAGIHTPLMALHEAIDEHTEPHEPAAK